MKIRLIFLLISLITFAQAQDTVFVTLKKSKEIDDTKIFQDALNRTDGKILKIYVKRGLYTVNSKLFSSRVNTHLKFEKGAIIYFSNSYMSGFTILHDKFILDGAHVKGAGISSKDFYTGYGVLLNGTSGCIIKECVFENLGGNNIFFFPKSSGIGCNYNQIIGNKFINPVFDLGSNGDESVILLGYSGEGYKHNDNVIKNNVIDCNYKVKIGISMISHGKNNLFENNTIRNCRNYGILLYESKDQDSTLFNNTLKRNSIYNIGEVSPKKTVKGMGIYLMKSSNSKVVYNKIYNTLINSDQTETLGAGAISISGSPNTIVSNNFISESNMYGIVSDYSFGSKFSNNTVQNIRKSGAYFINMNDVVISHNKFENIGEVVLKGYFEDTSMEYIKAQMRVETYKNIETGSGFVITDNIFYTDKDILYFTGTTADKKNKYLGNKIKRNVVENNSVYGSSKYQEDLYFFREQVEGTNIIKNNRSIK